MISYVGSDIITCNDSAGVRAHFTQMYTAIPATYSSCGVPVFHPHVNDLDVALDSMHQALVQVVAYRVKVEVWVMKDN